MLQVLQQEYGCKLCIGPCKPRDEVRLRPAIFVLVLVSDAIDLHIQGFFYDAFYADLGLNEQHFPHTQPGAAPVLLLCDIFI